MRDDTILTAIDEAVGSSARCACGKELHPTVDHDTVWLECPTFAGDSVLPARVAAFIRAITHDRRPVASLTVAPTTAPAAASAVRSVPTGRPVAIRL
jgi:hypothetical protein